jgi:hypothetical protein
MVKMVEVENKEEENMWAIRVFYPRDDLPHTLYLSQDKKAMEIVLDNFEKALGAARVIKFKEKSEEVSDA